MDKDFPKHIGWGHSTWKEGIRLARAAEARNIAIFHHDPDHEDIFMEEIEKQARSVWKCAFVARENMRVNMPDAGIEQPQIQQAQPVDASAA